MNRASGDESECTFIDTPSWSTEKSITIDSVLNQLSLAVGTRIAICGGAWMIGGIAHICIFEESLLLFVHSYNVPHQ